MATSTMIDGCVKLVPKYPCAQCGEHLPPQDFSSCMWDAAMGLHGLRARTNARCIACTSDEKGKNKRGASGFCKCSRCTERYPHAYFTQKPNLNNPAKRVCDVCLGFRSAMNDDKEIAGSECILREIQQANAQIPTESSTNISVVAQNHCVFLVCCFHCKSEKPQEEFSKVQLKKGDERVCKPCVRAHMKRYQSHGGNWRSVMPK